MRKKKILMVTQNFYPVIGSAGNRMKNLYKLLNTKEVETEVLTIEPSYPNKNLYHDEKFWDDEEINAEEEKETSKIKRVSIKNRRFTSRFLSRLFFYVEMMIKYSFKLVTLRKKQHDYIYVSTPPIFIVFSVLMTHAFSKSKIILEVRDLWPDSLVGVKKFDHPIILTFFRYFEKKMYNKADIIIVNSPGFIGHITEKLNRKDKEIIYIPNGPREDELIDKSASTDRFNVVYTGNLGLAQDIDRLKLLALELDAHQIDFEVVGYGVHEKDFRQYIDDHSLKHVKLRNATTRKESLAMIRRCDIAVAFLNDEEVFSTVLPGKIIDYMTVSTPIIAGVAGVSAEMITKNHVGIVYNHVEINKMVDKILELQENREELCTMQKNCRKVINENFLWENNINRILNKIRA
ncbi:glycosyltransferase family 4 protein [Salipaludibacillus sp. CF4.18]|uniref:glycosyltransferase family 4 protein n=1 Tax=Salipaludibacillus sp. CF4.18 TaxID=3373081 RepID=UPI003EE5EA05